MFEKLSLAFDMLNGHLVGLAAILFLLGIYSADYVIEKDIKWILRYPTWMSESLERLLQRFQGVVLLFLFIVLFNAVNLFLGFVSGFGLFLPFIFSVWMGLNIGVVLRNTIEEGNILLLLLNPVALIELPAGWISFSLGFEMSMHYLITRDFNSLMPVFAERSQVFLWIVLPLLALSGLLESVMIRFLRNQSDQEDS